MQPILPQAHLGYKKGLEYINFGKNYTIIYI